LPTPTHTHRRGERERGLPRAAVASTFFWVFFYDVIQEEERKRNDERDGLLSMKTEGEFLQFF